MKKLLVIALTLIFGGQVFAETVPNVEQRGVKCMVTAKVNGPAEEIILKRAFRLSSNMNTAKTFQFSADSKKLYWATVNYNYQTNALCLILEATNGKAEMFCESGSIIVSLKEFDKSAKNDASVVCQYHGQDKNHDWEGWAIDPIL